MDMDELLELYRSLRGRPAESFVEVGAAAHALEAARRGLRAVAVGGSSRTRERALDRAAEERLYLDFRLEGPVPRCDLGLLSEAWPGGVDVEVLVASSLEPVAGYRVERQTGEWVVWVRE